MIEARVRVVSASADMAWVSASKQFGCTACQSQSHCGISGLGKYLSRRRAELPVPFANARPGDELQIEVEEADLLRASLFVYLLPPMLAVIGAALADATGASDFIAVLIAGGGFLIALLGARFLAPMPRIRTTHINL